MTRRRLQPSVGLRLILRSVGKMLHAAAAIALVLCALALVGLIMALGKSVRMTRRPRQVARGLVGRFSSNRFSPD